MSVPDSLGRNNFAGSPACSKREHNKISATSAKIGLKEPDCMSSRPPQAWWRHPWRLVSLTAAVVIGLGLILCAYYALTHYEILEKGPILPWVEGGNVYKVRVGGWLTFYFQPDIHPRHLPDLLNAYVLTGVAFVGLTFAVVLRAAGHGAGSPGVRFFFVAFVGFSYLVADELVGIHESIGHNMPFLRRLPLVHRPDDVLILAMAIPVGLFLFYFRSLLLASRRAVIAFAAGILCFLVAAVSDLFALPVEDPAEVLASACLLAGFLLLGLHLTGHGSMPNSRSRR